MSPSEWDVSDNTMDSCNHAPVLLYPLPTAALYFSTFFFIWYTAYLLIYCVSPPLECQLHDSRGVCLFCSLLHLQCMSHSVNIKKMNGPLFYSSFASRSASVSPHCWIQFSNILFRIWGAMFLNVTGLQFIGLIVLSLFLFLPSTF